MLISGPQALLRPVPSGSSWLSCVGASARALDSTARCTTVVTCNPDCFPAALKVSTSIGLHSQPPPQLSFRASTHFFQKFVHALEKAVSAHELHCCWLAASPARGPFSMYLKQQGSTGVRLRILGIRMPPKARRSARQQLEGGDAGNCCWSARCMTLCMHWPVTPGAPCKLHCC